VGTVSSFSLFSTGRPSKSDNELAMMPTIDLDNGGFEEINLQSVSANETSGDREVANVDNVQTQEANQSSGLVRFFRR